MADLRPTRPALQIDYRLENWNRLRAPGCPDFFRSFILGSRVSKPSSFKAGLIATSCSNSARAIANRTAPACPEAPPPVALTCTSKVLLVLVTSKGFKTVNWSAGVGKYSSSGRPLTSIFPDPRERRTCATAFLRRPVAANTSDIFSKLVRQRLSAVAPRAGAAHPCRPSILYTAPCQDDCVGSYL